MFFPSEVNAKLDKTFSAKNIQIVVVKLRGKRLWLGQRTHSQQVVGLKLKPSVYKMIENN
jgi:hypothetical protein